MNTSIFKDLNEQQTLAVKHTDGPSIILAGAGSGKTRVLVYKVLNLIENHGVSPLNILMITFTNKAAAEMKSRMGLKRLGYVGTFHSFCAMTLRRDGERVGVGSKFIIYDEADQLSLIKSIIKTIEVNKYTPSYFLNRISAAKNQLISPSQYLNLFADYNAAMVAEIYGKYEKGLQKNSALDFDDLIMKVVKLFTKNRDVLIKYQARYQYILVDEFQDTNLAQYTLTRLLGEKSKNITVVGDFSQSIYSWRGADIRNLEKFREDFPETQTFNLEQNYRSTQNILDFAYSVISKNQTHPILELFTKNDRGEEVAFYQAENEEYEAHYLAGEIERLKLPYTSYAVLYRTNAQSRIIEEVFLHYSIPYVLVGGTRFYERKEVKDVLSYVRLMVNENDEVAQERIKKLGKRKWTNFLPFIRKQKKMVDTLSTSELMEKIFAVTGYLNLYKVDDEEDYSRLENIKELKSVAVNFPNTNEFLEQVALVESEYSEGEKKSGRHTGVRLMTLHQAKGLEFPVVFIVGVEEGILPHVRSIDDVFALEEERRLFYVGITRAQKKLYITYSGKRFIFGRRGDAVKSRFITSEEEVGLT